MKQELLRLYLIYVNNFLTIRRFAEYYGIRLDKAYRIVRLGSKLNNR